MKIYAFYQAKGFTLAEIIVCIVLLSITTVSVLKISATIQTSISVSLIRFNQLHEDKQLFALSELKQHYDVISVDEAFADLHCLVDTNQSCQ